MKWPLLPICLLAGICLTSSPLLGADRNLEGLAARQEVEDFMRSANTRIRDMEESLQAQQRRITALEDEIRKLREDVVRATRNQDRAGMEQALNKLSEDVKEVDRRRLADNKLTLEKLERLERLLLNRAKETPRATEGPATPKINPKANLFEYSVQKGDYLAKIVSKLKAQGVQVTPKAIEDANPGVNWNKLQVNQKIVVPVPKE